MASDADIEHFCAGVVHPETGETITSYKKLIADPITYDVWSRAFGKEFGSLAQGDNLTGEKGTNCLYVMSPEDVKKIPKDRVITYGRIVVDYRPQKDDPNRVRITAGGDKMKGTFDGEISTRAADLTTSKVMWNSVLSTTDAKYMTIDIKNFFPTAPLEKYEYMKMPLSVFPQHVKDQYNLDALAVRGYVFLEMRWALYGLPQGNVSPQQVTMRSLIPLDYGDICGDPSHSRS